MTTTPDDRTDPFSELEEEATEEPDTLDEPELPERSEIMLPGALERILEHVPDEEKGEVVTSIGQIAARYSGPVPLAGEMRRYKEIDASFPERFVSMAERQAAHRQAMETKLVEGDIALKRRGQDYALISVVIGMLVALVFGYMDLPIVAGVVAGTTVVGVVSAFVVGRVVATKAQSSSDEDEDE